MLAEAADPLPSFNVDLAKSSVSGLSSGAYMAGQFHVAFSKTLKGAAIIAGGPYACARGQLPLALSQCMQTILGAPDASELLERAPSLESKERIDPVSHLLDDRVSSVESAVAIVSNVAYRGRLTAILLDVLSCGEGCGPIAQTTMGTMRLDRPNHGFGLAWWREASRRPLLHYCTARLIA